MVKAQFKHVTHVQVRYVVSTKQRYCTMSRVKFLSSGQDVTIIDTACVTTS